MKTKTINLYTFEELTDELRARVIEKHRDINVDYYWEEVEKWNFDDKLKERGFTNNKIFYSGFGSQGDGASFTSDVDLNKYVEHYKGFLVGEYDISTLLWDIEQGGEAIIKVKKFSSHYDHEKTMTIESDNNLISDKGCEQLGKLGESILNVAQNLASEFYKELEQLYFDLQEDAQVIDTLVSNEYLFNDKGDIDHE